MSINLKNMYQLEKYKELIDLTFAGRKYVLFVYNQLLKMAFELNKGKQLRAFAYVVVYDYVKNTYGYYHIDNIQYDTPEAINQAVNFLRNQQFIQPHKIVRVFSVYPTTLLNTLTNKKFKGLVLFGESELRAYIDYYEFTETDLAVIKHVDEDNYDIAKLMQFSSIIHYQMHLN